MTKMEHPAERGRSLVVTQGARSGVGPELLLRLAADGVLRAGDVVVADGEYLEGLSKRLLLEARQAWAPAGFAAIEPLLDPELRQQRPDQLEALERGVDLVLGTPGRALVTGPIDKAQAVAAGFAFPGHTEYLAARAGGVDVVMLMAGTTLRVALCTVHIPLRSVADRLDVQGIVTTGRVLVAGLRASFGIDRPRIGVLGLNPHAGEQGVLGDEEQRIITPAIERLREDVPEATFVGPLPADSAFHAQARGHYDALLAMYHDQALGPFKLAHFTDGVNMTLGLPFIRTSPDHGTARDIAGRGIADPSSYAAAIAMARGA